MDILKISDSELRSIQPKNIERLLENSGWKQHGGIPDVSRQWVYVSENSAQSVVVPLDTRFDDYTIRLRELLKRLVASHPNRLETILLQIELPGADQLDNRKDAPSIAGSVAWKDGEDQFIGFRKQLTASAKAAEDRQRRFGRSHRRIAQEFMAQLRMGQTRVGSFIITALSPVGPLPTTNKGGVYDSQLVGVTGRQVVETMVSSLDTLKLATDDYLTNGHDHVFDETVDVGVSVELLSGLRANLGTAAAVETTITWNPEVQRKTTSRITEIVFEARHREGLRVAQKRLQKITAPQKVDITGTVVSLERATPGEKGVITVRVVHEANGADIDVVKLHLEDEYDEAVESHKSGDILRIRGTLGQKGAQPWITVLDLLALRDSRGHDQVLFSAPLEEKDSNPEKSTFDDDDVGDRG